MESYRDDQLDKLDKWERLANIISRIWNKPIPNFIEITDCCFIIFSLGLFVHCSLLMLPFTTWQKFNVWYGNHGHPGHPGVDYLIFEVAATCTHILLGISNCYRNLYKIPKIWLIFHGFYEIYLMYVFFYAIAPWSKDYSTFRLAENTIRFFLNIWFALIIRVYGAELRHERKFLRRAYQERAYEIQTKVALRRKHFVLPYTHNQRPKFGFGIKLRALELYNPEYFLEGPKPPQPDPEPLEFEPELTGMF